jgi:phosphatidylglycerol:prolipoprotein diacylglycerol transferase
MDSGIAFKIGPVVVHWYGLLIVIGAVLGGYVATHEARRRGENPEHIWDGLLWCIILGLVGARLYHVFSSPADGSGGFSHYVENPIAILAVWDGGLGIYGAVAGGVVAVLIYARRNRLDAWRWLDIGAPGLALAQAIGRWGNFVNQELYGPPTTLPWGLYIGAEHRIPRYSDLTRYPTDTTRFHPTFLYESLWNLGVFAVLMWGGRRWAHRLRDGDIFLAYLLLYPLGRLWIEQFFRPDAWAVGGGLPAATLISLGVALVAGLAICVRHRRVKVEGEF